MPDLASILRSAAVTAPVDPLVTVGGQSVFSMTVRGTGAAAMWKKLFSLLRRTQHYPVLCGEANDAKKRLQKLAGHDPLPLLAAADALNLDDWQAARIADDPDRFDYDPRPFPTAATPNSTFITPLDPVTKSPWPSLLIALFPFRPSSPLLEAGPSTLAALNFQPPGSPPGAAHIALARRWQQRYQAHVAAVTADTLEFHVLAPPQTEAAAIALAREHYLYAPTSVDQDAGSIEALAARLLNAPVWHFWWE